MFRLPSLALVATLCTLAPVGPARAASTYIALGDSLTFGETDLIYRQSNGDRGYVGRVADALAARSGGARPNVINLAIDGETSASFTTGVGRVPPVTGRTDAILAAENTNYNPNALVPQGTLFQAAVATQRALGNTVDTVSITLGTNDLFTLFNSPGFTPGSAVDPMLATALATYRANYSAILGSIRSLLPNANLLIVGTYNPFPADPTNTFGPLAAAGGPLFNSVMQSLAAQYGGRYVDVATPFLGHEAAYTFQDELPQNSTVGGMYGGSLPLGNVHPNDLGYGVIAAAALAVPEPSSLSLLGLAAGLIAGLGRVARRRTA